MSGAEPAGRASRWALRRKRAKDAALRAWGRVRADAWPLAQRALAATIAWFLALWIGDHPDPFFAPIAAVVALNASYGHRGLNALRLLLGVIVGILSGEGTLLLLGGGFGTLALATFVAMLVARALGGAPIVIAQAASAAILTVVISDGEVGPERMMDAAIGAGVALVFSQLLFTPEPVRLLRRAETTALRTMADGMRLLEEAVRQNDRSKAEASVQRLRALQSELADLSTVRAASGRIAQHSLPGRTRLALVVREQESAGHLDLLGVSCLTLARTTLAVGSRGTEALGATIATTAVMLAELAEAPGDMNVRQGVVDRVPDLLGDLADEEHAADPSLGAMEVACRIVIADLMVFAGVDAKAAATAASAGAARLREPPAPPPSKPSGLAKFLPWNWRLPLRRKKRKADTDE